MWDQGYGPIAGNHQENLIGLQTRDSPTSPYSHCDFPPMGRLQEEIYWWLPSQIAAQLKIYAAICSAVKIELEEWWGKRKRE